MFWLAPVAAFGAAASISACAGTAAPEPATAAAEGRSCFFLSQVNGFNDVPDTRRGSDSVVVSVGVRDKYLFETFGPCPDLDWSEAIAFDQRGPGQICDGLDVDLIVPGPTGPKRCAVRMVRKISEAEYKAMRARPKT
ncbi:hypothetical protein B2G71_09430 [Novosphingobium sp. PC22D]|nr:hypothetical protein B2G71_09430 [Novosphingobium sp. PC22D]